MPPTDLQGRGGELANEFVRNTFGPREEELDSLALRLDHALALGGLLAPRHTAGATASDSRILMLEGSASEAERMASAIEEGGIVCYWRRAASWDGFSDALEAFRPGLVLADSALLASDRQALGIARYHRIPVIVMVAGEPGVEPAVSGSLASWASDHVPRDDLARLAPAVRRAIGEEKPGLRVLRHLLRRRAAPHPIAFVCKPDEGLLRYERVFRQEQGYAWRTLKRNGVPDAVAQELCQEMFMVLCERLPTIENPRGWIKTWCVRNARGHRNSAAARREVVTPTPGSEETAPGGPEDYLVNCETRQALARSLCKLSKAQRRLVWLFVVEELPGEEVAARVRRSTPRGYSASNTYKKLPKSLEELKRLLEDFLTGFRK